MYHVHGGTPPSYVLPAPGPPDTRKEQRPTDLRRGNDIATFSGQSK